MTKHIEAALKKAAITLQYLPQKQFAGYASYWPDVVRSRAEILLSKPYHKSRVRNIKPAEITAMDEVLNWLFILPPEERKLVWARACNVSWRQLEDHDGRSSVTLRKIHNQSLTKIANVLSDDEKTRLPTETPPSRFKVHQFKSNPVRGGYFSSYITEGNI